MTYTKCDRCHRTQKLFVHIVGKEGHEDNFVMLICSECKSDLEKEHPNAQTFPNSMLQILRKRGS
jgi:hypothetical protein